LQEEIKPIEFNCISIHVFLPFTHRGVGTTYIAALKTPNKQKKTHDEKIGYINSVKATHV
jgi:hypothetical protein